MAAANVCDVCGGTIVSTQPRTILAVHSAVGREHSETDAEIDVCDKCRADQAECLAQAITNIVVKLRSEMQQDPKRKTGPRP